ncbi:hypothetical protein RIEPE_0569 [Candidatus Riesia pediculicola USDA]|uniref:Uncharacterized protein n=1 Tax=Riesia pediculicola (strain USDA) TaxID=515618 RepID=D4G8Z3_RIEPU|nr:hypothetical protein RIEPE_0569 [Candidatus Riesia pediculicola USDA]
MINYLQLLFIFLLKESQNKNLIFYHILKKILFFKRLNNLYKK